jgi:hypothetical protein
VTRTRVPTILVMAENAQTPSSLAKRLRQVGCLCSFATSYSEALWLLRNRSFDLVLSPMRLQGITVLPAIDLLEGSRVTLFYSHAVERGCWWLPALRRGEKCFGSAAFRSSDFGSVLDEVIAEIQMDPVLDTRQPTQQSAPTGVEVLSSRNGLASALSMHPLSLASAK